MQICLPCQRILTPPTCPGLQVLILQWSMHTDMNHCTLHFRTTIMKCCIISQHSHDATTDHVMHSTAHILSVHDAHNMLFHIEWQQLNNTKIRS